MAKKIYWTKCGIEFQKSSTAEVTGYELTLLPTATDPLKVKDDIKRKECRTCPFVRVVKEGYPDPVFKRFECRAGSEKPNHKTDWTGSLDDKNTIGVNSLDIDLMDKILQYCKDHPDLSASYNTDHLADCRRTLSISCSSNKKGIAAKRELIEKFFPYKAKENVCPKYKGSTNPKSEFPVIRCGESFTTYGKDKTKDWEKTLKNCLHSPEKCCLSPLYKTKAQEVEEVKQDCTTCLFVKSSDETGKVNCSEHTKKKDFIPTSDCPQYTPGNDYKPQLDVLSDWEAGEIDEDGNEADSYGPDEKECPNCGQDNCPFNNGNGGCCFDDEDPQSAGFSKDVIDAVKGFGCKTLEVLKQYEAISNTDITDNTIGAQTMTDTQVVDHANHDINSNDHCCGNCSAYSGDNKANYHCNKLSAYKDSYGVPLPQAQGCSDFNHKCSKNSNGTSEIDTKTAETVTFDYSTVDADTAEFLQEKASKITEIRIKSVIALGKEFKESQDKLSNNKTGNFQSWVKSIGFDPKTAYNYINAFNYIMENFHNIEDAEKFQPSLLFAVSKKDAPKELQEQVLSGDITTHKQYKEKEAEWKSKVDEVRAQQDALRVEKQQAITKAFDAERKVDRLEGEIEELRDQMDELKDQAEQQDPQIISALKDRIQELEKELKDKPIEAAAIQVVEKIPERAAHETIHRLYGTLMAAKIINNQDIQIVHEHANFEMKEAIIEFFENLLDMIPGYLDILKDNVPTRKCEDCHYCEWEDLKEEDELKGLIYCKFHTPHNPQLWPNEKACENWCERRV